MKALMLAAVLAAMSTAAPAVVNAEGICVCGMKRPLKADHPKPLGTLHIDASNIWHRPL
jgi:hypothetical protein